MNKQITFTPPGAYSGRNGYTNLHGVDVFTTADDTRVFMSPINSRGPAASTFMEFHKEDVPALIALLQESIGQTSGTACNGERNYVVMTSIDEHLDTKILTTKEDLSSLTGRHTETSIAEEGKEFENRLTEVLDSVGMTYDLGYSLLDFIAIDEVEYTPTAAAPPPSNIADKEFEEINFDYEDDKGVTHVDGYHMNSEEGECLGFIFSGEFYPKDNDIRTNKQVMEAVKEHLSEISKETQQ